MSSTTPVWRVVAEREVRTRLRDKAFLGATAFSLLLIVGFFVVAPFIGAGADEYDVAVTTEADQALVTAAEEAMRGSNAPDAVLTADVAADADEAEELVSAGDVDAARTGRRIAWREALKLAS